jgi:pSer/pThr/pTyr-binding forkhead associated (FHA) protein
MPGEKNPKSATASPRTPGGRTTPVLVPQGVLAGQPDVPLDRPVTTVGSNENARLHLVSRTVSKGHAIFVNTGGTTYVADMASRTGVLVNGKLVKDSELKTGDRVQIGKFVFRYRSPASSVPLPPQPQSPAAAVIVVGSPAVAVKGRTIIIGRRETSDIAIPGDSGVSSAHAVIFQMEGRWYIRDLGSRTGTQVNGNPIHQQELKFGDRIVVGSTNILFQPSAARVEDPEDSFAPDIPADISDELPADELAGFEPVPVAVSEPVAAPEPIPVEATEADDEIPLGDWRSAIAAEPVESPADVTAEAAPELEIEPTPVLVEVEPEQIPLEIAEAPVAPQAVPAAVEADDDLFSLADEVSAPVEEPVAVEPVPQPAGAESADEFALAEEAPAEVVEPPIEQVAKVEPAASEIEFTDEVAPAVAEVHPKAQPAAPAVAAAPAYEHLLADVDDFVFVPTAEPVDPNAVPDLIFWGDPELDSLAEQAVTPAKPSPVVDDKQPPTDADGEPPSDGGPSEPPDDSPPAPEPVSPQDSTDSLHEPSAADAEETAPVTHTEFAAVADIVPEHHGEPAVALDALPPLDLPEIAPIDAGHTSTAQAQAVFHSVEHPEPAISIAGNDTLDVSAVVNVDAVDAPSPKPDPDLSLPVVEAPAIGSIDAQHFEAEHVEIVHEPVAIEPSADLVDPVVDDRDEFFTPLSPALEEAFNAARSWNEAPADEDAAPFEVIEPFAPGNQPSGQGGWELETSPQAVHVLEPEPQLGDVEHFDVGATDPTEHPAQAVSHELEQPEVEADVPTSTPSHLNGHENGHEIEFPRLVALDPTPAPEISAVLNVHSVVSDDPQAVAADAAMAVGDLDLPEISPAESAATDWSATINVDLDEPVTVSIAPQAQSAELTEQLDLPDLGPVAKHLDAGPDAETILDTPTADVPVTTHDTGALAEVEFPIAQAPSPVDISATLNAELDLAAGVSVAAAERPVDALHDDLELPYLGDADPAASAPVDAEASFDLVEFDAAVASEQPPEPGEVESPAVEVPSTDVSGAANVELETPDVASASSVEEVGSIPHDELDLPNCGDVENESIAPVDIEASYEIAEFTPAESTDDEIEFADSESPVAEVVEHADEAAPIDPIDAGLELPEIAEEVEVPDFGDFEPESAATPGLADESTADEAIDATDPSTEAAPSEETVEVSLSLMDISQLAFEGSDEAVPSSEVSASSSETAKAPGEDLLDAEPTVEPAIQADATEAVSDTEAAVQTASSIPESTVTETPRTTDFSGVVSADADAAIDEPVEESITMSEDWVPPAQAVVESAHTTEPGASDLDLLDFAEPEAQPAAEQQPVVETPQAKTPEVEEPPAQPKPASAAPRKGPSLFGFEFEGGSFLGGMPISLADKSAIPKPPVILPTAPAPVAAPVSSSAFDAKATPPAGLGSIVAPVAAPVPPAPIPRPAVRPTVPPPVARATGASLSGLISDARSTSGPPVIPPVIKGIAGNTAASGVGLTGATTSAGLGARNVEVFSQLSAPIGVEVFGGRPGNPDQFTVPDIKDTPLEIPEPESSDEESQTEPQSETAAEHTSATPTTQNSRWWRAPLWIILMIAVPAAAWQVAPRVITESSTFTGALAFSGLKEQQPVDFHNFEETQKALLLGQRSDEIRLGAKAILLKDGHPSGFTADPAQFAQAVQTQDFVFADDHVDFTLAWPDPVMARAQVDAVLLALAQKDQVLADARHQALLDADAAKTDLEAVNAEIAKLQTEYHIESEKASEKPDALSVSQNQQDVITLTDQYNSAHKTRVASESVLAELKAQDPNKPIDPDSDKEIVDLKKRLDLLNEQIRLEKSKGGVSATAGTGVGTDVSVGATTQPDSVGSALLKVMQDQADSWAGKLQRRRDELAALAAIPADQRAVNLAGAIENLSIKITALQKSEDDLKGQLDQATLKKSQYQQQTEAANIAQAHQSDLYQQMQKKDAEKQQKAAIASAKELAYENSITVASQKPATFVSVTNVHSTVALAISVLAAIVFGRMALVELMRPRIITSARPKAAPLVNPPARVIPWPQPHQLQGLKSDGA